MGIGYVFSFLAVVLFCPAFAVLFFRGSCNSLIRQCFYDSTDEEFQRLSEEMTVSYREQQDLRRLVNTWFERGIDYVCDIMQDDFKYIFGDNYRERFACIYNQHINDGCSMTDITHVCALLFAREGKCLKSWGFQVPLVYCDDYETNMRMCSRIELLWNDAGVKERLELYQLSESIAKGFGSNSKQMRGRSGKEMFYLHIASLMDYSDTEHSYARLYHNKNDGFDGFEITDLSCLNTLMEQSERKVELANTIFRWLVVFVVLLFLVGVIIHC